MKILFSNLATRIAAYHTCVKLKNTEWAEKHFDEITDMCKHLPSGSGIDSGVSLQLGESTEKRIVFKFSYHHMNEDGYYDGWTEHILIVTPLFGDFSLVITGRDRNEVKDYLFDLFNEVFE